MPKFKRLDNSFAFGELGPEVSGRSDLKEYFQGARNLVNFIPNQQGSISRRPSFSHKIDVPNPSVLPDQVLVPVTSVERLGFCALTISGEDIYVIPTRLNNDELYLYCYHKSVDLGGNEIFTTRVEFLTFTEGKGLGALSFFKLGAGAVITSSVGVIPPLYFTLSYTTTLTITSVENIYRGVGNLNSVNPFSGGVIKSDYIFPLSMPFKAPSVSGDTFVVVSNVSANEYIVDLEGAGYEVVGKFIRVRNGAFERLFYIYDSSGLNYKAWCINPQAASGAIEAIFQSTPTDNWLLSAWGGGDGFPTSAGYHMNRLILGGIPGEPSDVIWLSQTDDIYQNTQQRYYTNPVSDPIQTGYDGEAQASDAFSRVLGASNLDTVKWITSENNLLVGTDTSEYAVYSTDGTFTASTVGTRQQSGHGGAAVIPIVIDGASIFISGDGKTLREIRFSNESQSYITENLNKLHPDIIFKNRSEHTISYTDMQFQGNSNTAWFLTSVGTLITATIDLPNRVIAWARIDSVISFDGIDLVTINNQTKLAVLSADSTILIADLLNTKREDVSCDYKKSYSESSAYNIPITVNEGENYSYLSNGQETTNTAVGTQLIVPYRFPLPITGSGVPTKVQISNGVDSILIDVPSSDVGDDFVKIPVSDSTIVEGQLYTVSAFPNDLVDVVIRRGIIVPVEAGTTVVGKKFESHVETMPLDIMSQLGNSLGDMTTAPLIDVLTERASPFYVGANGSNEEYLYTPVQENSTGVHRVEIPNAIERDHTVSIKSKGMLPLDINGIKITGSSY